MPPISRRRLLRSLPLISLAPTVPGFLANLARASAPEPDARILVVLQLDGGNDGLNTVVPFADDAYTRARKALRLDPKALIPISDGIGLHPAMRSAGDLVESGRLAIVPGVGYPNPNRSHFASMAIWHSARLDPDAHSGPGWLGRALDPSPRQSSTFVGDGSIPPALQGRRTIPTSLRKLDDLTLDPNFPRPTIPFDNLADDPLAFVRRCTLDTYAASDRLTELSHGSPSSVRYPDSALGEHLQLIARLIRGGFSSRIYYTGQPGYDTHSAQVGTHYGLLSDLSRSLKAFLDDLAADSLADRVLILAFSEFGRRVSENASAGTDHGAAGPVFLAGPSVKLGLIGPYPSLTDLDDGDLKHHTDFRRVYASVLDQWLGIPSSPILGAHFHPLPLLKS